MKTARLWNLEAPETAPTVLRGHQGFIINAVAISPNNQWLVTYAYDEVGNRSVLTDGNGAVTSFIYDPLNRLTTINYPNDQSDQVDGFMGHAVSGAGDVNGDGYDDVIVSAPYYQANEGYVWLYLGSETGLSDNAAWVGRSNLNHTYFGQALSAGDLNGDGYSDIIIGAPGNPYAERPFGRVFIYFGSQSGLIETPTIIKNDELGDQFGLL